jgi:hypothetical protein
MSEMTFERDPCVAIFVFDNFVGKIFSKSFDTGVIETTANQSLCGEEGVFWVCDGLSLCRCSDDSLAIFSECDHRRGCSLTLGVCNDFGETTFNDTDARVGCSKIDAYNIIACF